MAYLSQFENDLFISYRHVSNKDIDIWVDTLRMRLDNALKDRVGDGFKIWEDTIIRGGDEWRLKISEALKDSAIFLAIISRSYLDSPECRTELDQFLGWAKKSPEDKKRIIVPIFKHPPKPEQRVPKEFKQAQFYQFFEPDGSDIREFSPGPDIDKKNIEEFNKALARLIWDLVWQLEMLAGIATKNSLGTVYLANAGPELDKTREELRVDLQQRGYRVVPASPYIWNSDSVREDIEEELGEACLCVHLVARSESTVLETPERTRLQLEIANEVMKNNHKPLPLVWIQPLGQIHNKTDQLIDYVKQELSNEGVEYWEGGLEDFKTQIFDKLPKPEVKTAQVTTMPASEIALIVEEGDLAMTGEINNLLVAKINVETNRIYFSGTMAKNPDSLEKTMARYERCILFWGAQSEDWVKDILATGALAGHVGCERLCVYAAAPMTPEKNTFCTSKARVILAAPAGNETELREFLATEEGGQ